MLLHNKSELQILSPRKRPKAFMTDRVSGVIALVRDKYVITQKQGDLKYSHVFQHSDGTYQRPQLPVHPQVPTKEELFRKAAAFLLLR
jgi:hypothetical protein